jgi:hypothetical protein
VRAQTWSIGGAALATSDASRITLWTNTDGMSVGVEPTNSSLSQTPVGGSGMQTGGFLAWQTSIYRIDAQLSPSFDGQVFAGVGASVGAMPGESGTRYGLRIGTAWAPTSNFTVNPNYGVSLAELSAPNRNVNVSFLINHALTPNLNLIGLAEAQRNFGLSAIEGNSGFGRLVVGAGLGYKF